MATLRRRRTSHYDPGMAPHRTRRLVVLAVLAGVIVAIGLYRRRELARNAETFEARYG